MYYLSDSTSKFNFSSLRNVHDLFTLTVINIWKEKIYVEILFL